MNILESLNGAAGALLSGVLNSLWLAALVATIAWLAMRYAPRMNAATKHALWWAVLFTVLALPVAPMISAKLHRPTQTPIRVVSAPVAPDDEALDLSISPVSGPTPIAESAAVEWRAGKWPILFLAIWLIVVAVQLRRIGSSYLYLRHLKRTAIAPSFELRQNFDAWMLSCGIRRPARLLISQEVTSPMAIGFRHPAVIIPATLLNQVAEPELDHVLLHELAHVARHDDWLNLAARAAGAGCALHPIAALVLRQIEREREIACDDWVVSKTGEARSYAASLARLFEICFVRRRLMLASGMAGRASHLGQRIEMLLRRSREFAPNASITRVGVTSAILLGLAITGSQAPHWLVFAQDAPVPPAAPAKPSPVRGNMPPTPPRAIRTVPPATPAPPPPPPAAALAAPAPIPGPVPPAAPRGSFLGALVAAGYGNLAVDDIINLKNNGISADYISGISASGWGQLKPQEMIDLHNRGVSAQYVRKMKDAGFRELTVSDVIEMSSNGVRAENMQAIHALGFGPYSARQAIRIAQHGIGVGLFQSLRDAGVGNASLDEIQEAQETGVNAHSLNEAKQFGPNLTLKQISKLKRAGVI
jgi:beta-lactamase regulating signal transducer with metallopeptidase domain